MISLPLEKRSMCDKAWCYHMTSFTACTNSPRSFTIFGRVPLVNLRSIGPTTWTLQMNWAFKNRKLGNLISVSFGVQIKLPKLFWWSYSYTGFGFLCFPCQEFPLHVPVSWIYFWAWFQSQGFRIDTYLFQMYPQKLDLFQQCVWAYLPRYVYMEMELTLNNTLNWCLCWLLSLGLPALWIAVWHYQSETAIKHPLKQENWSAMWLPGLLTLYDPWFNLSIWGGLQSKNFDTRRCRYLKLLWTYVPITSINLRMWTPPWTRSLGPTVFWKVLPRKGSLCKFTYRWSIPICLGRNTGWCRFHCSPLRTQTKLGLYMEKIGKVCIGFLFFI